ncbi:MAG: hypothetical protein H0T62_12400 [Parachlamydiaceae bacterium]|nr:hypothetical protein [Parachlamydiaceae bacterium]
MINNIRTFLSPFVVSLSTSQVVCLYKRCFASCGTVKKTNALFQQKIEWNDEQTNKAMSLIFGERQYINFTPDEQRLTDLFQERMMDEDAITLPNTRAAVEEEVIEEIRRQQYKE